MAGVGTRITLGAVLALAAALALPGSASALDWHRCAGASARPAPRCATLTVPLDRTGAIPGTVPLKLERLDASAAAAPTLVYLSGGPGGAGIEEMLAVLPLVPMIRDRYHVVGFDQRGTGGSGLLRCPALERHVRLRSVSAGEACAKRLGPARRLYTTPDSVEDLEAIRIALGVDRLTLFGISYGTELALAYARAHPDHVDRLILDSVVDPDDRDPFGLAGFRAMGPTLTGLCPAGCRGLTSDPLGDLARLAARVRTRQARGVAYDGRGRGHRRAVGQTGLADLMYDSDYNPPLRAAVPAAVHAALRGDNAPLMRLVAEGDKLAELPSPRSFSSARYATVCEETPLPWDPATPLDARLAEARRRATELGPAAFAPFDLRTAAADEIGLCLHWPDVPSGRVPAPAAPYPAVPTLILQGGEDLRTPPEGSARVAAAIAGAQRVVVPGVGHAVTGGDPSGCGLRALDRFLAGEPGRGDCPRVATGVPAVSPPPRSLGSIPPLRRLGGRAGRTAAAIGTTIDDLAFALSPAFLSYSGGGLRGGWFRVSRGRLLVHRYTVVRGMWVTGVASRGVIRLRVGGRAAAHGRVTLRSGGRLRGRLGGRRVRVRLPGFSSAAMIAARPPGSAGSAADPVSRLFLAASATKLSHLGLVPSPAR